MVHYEAGAHDAQMQILRALLLTDSMAFSGLARATGLTNDHANFHLKQLIQSGYISKVSKTHGRYQLTKHGKEYANRMDTEEALIEKQPKLSVVIVIEREDGKFLLQQRQKQPYFDYWGNMTGKIRWGETMLEAARRELKEETGLEADMRVCGFIHKLDHSKSSNELLEDKYFCIIYGIEPVGELISDTDGQHNEWLTVAELEGKEKKFANAKLMIDLAHSGDTIVEERRYYYRDEDY